MTPFQKFLVLIYLISLGLALVGGVKHIGVLYVIGVIGVGESLGLWAIKEFERVYGRNIY